MAEPADLNLDELRRRGRRRLIGAIVLALVAAVVVPMLLESDPRPLGEDVSVRIPPVDDGKFVNKLSEPRPRTEPAKDAAAPAPSPQVAPVTPPPTSEAPQRKSVADAEKAVVSPTPAMRPPSEARTPAKAPELPKAADTAKAAPPAAEPPREGFVVQLAAFSDDKGANALAGKLKRAGYPAYTEAVTSSRGPLWRVRVGGYPSRDAAGQARDRLKGEGHSGIVVPAK